MNGVHDLGGLQDMGPVQYEKDEPAFHAAWEGRILGSTGPSGSLANGTWMSGVIKLNCFRPPTTFACRITSAGCR